jgi:uncharacterized membrane protein
VWAIFSLIGIGAAGFILLTLGIYFLIRAFSWEKNIALLSGDIKSGFLTGRLSIYTYIIAIIVIVAFGIYAYTNTDFTNDIWFIPVLSFIFDMIIGIVIAGLSIIFGRLVDIYVRDTKWSLSHLAMFFSFLAFGFISYGSLFALKHALENLPAEVTYDAFTGNTFIFSLVSGILILIIGAIVHHNLKENNHIEEDIKKKTKKIADKN